MAENQKWLPKEYHFHFEPETRENFSAAFLERLNWQTYASYGKDMEEMLQEFEQPQQSAPLN